MKEAMDLYHNDPPFQNLVNTLLDAMRKHDYSILEVRMAATLAINLYWSERPWPSIMANAEEAMKIAGITGPHAVGTPREWRRVPPQDLRDASVPDPEMPEQPGEKPKTLNMDCMCFKKDDDDPSR